MKRPLTCLMYSLLVLACGVATAQDAAEKKDVYWKPKLGQTWTYRVTVEAPNATSLPQGIPGQKLEKLEGKQRVTYTQTNAYKGEQVIDPKAEKPKKAHVFHVSNGDRLEEIQYMSITAKGLEAIGSKPEGAKPQEALIFNKAIPLIWEEWKGGEQFQFAMDPKIRDRKVSLVRKFKVIGWEELKTKAGKFRCLHVQSSGKNGAIEIKRSYWFSPDNGFIKEVKKYYAGEKLIFSQLRVLEGVK